MPCLTKCNKTIIVICKDFKTSFIRCYTLNQSIFYHARSAEEPLVEGIAVRAESSILAKSPEKICNFASPSIKICKETPILASRRKNNVFFSRDWPPV